jgi:hypothetical protein
VILPLVVGIGVAIGANGAIMALKMRGSSSKAKMCRPVSKQALMDAPDEKQKIYE